MAENAPINSLDANAALDRVTRGVEGLKVSEAAARKTKAASSSGARKGRKKGVQFAGVEHVHEFAARDAPSTNILDVISAAAGDARDAGAATTPGPRRAQRVLQVDDSADYRVAFALHEIEGMVQAEFDTETMTVAELRQALESHELSTSGTKAQLKARSSSARLEQFITGKETVPKERASRRKKAPKADAPDWLSCSVEDLLLLGGEPGGSAELEGRAARAWERLVLRHTLPGRYTPTPADAACDATPYDAARVADAAQRELLRMDAIDDALPTGPLVVPDDDDDDDDDGVPGLEDAPYAFLAGLLAVQPPPPPPLLSSSPPPPLPPSPPQQPSEELAVGQRDTGASEAPEIQRAGEDEATEATPGERAEEGIQRSPAGGEQAGCGAELGVADGPALCPAIVLGRREGQGAEDSARALGGVALLPRQAATCEGTGSAELAGAEERSAGDEGEQYDDDDGASVWSHGTEEMDELAEAMQARRTEAELDSLRASACHAGDDSDDDGDHGADPDEGEDDSVLALQASEVMLLEAEEALGWDLLAEGEARADLELQVSQALGETPDADLLGALLAQAAHSALACTTRVVNAPNSTTLAAALRRARPGDTIRLSATSYAGTFTAAVPGLPDCRVRLEGTPGRTLLRGPTTGTGYGLYLHGASYWDVYGVGVSNSLKGIMMDNCEHVVLDTVDVGSTGEEAVAFRNFSRHNTLRNSRVHDTGLKTPDYGECVYVGQWNGNWKYGRDACDGNVIENNTLGPRCAAEPVDIKEGTQGGVVRGNTIDGAGIKGKNYADSWIDVQGNNWTIVGNSMLVSGAAVFVDGIQVHDMGVALSGDFNYFAANTMAMPGSATGVGISVQDTTVGNVVCTSNTLVGTQQLTNVQTTTCASASLSTSLSPATSSYSEC
eukprot:m51a1_g13911 hypothetical protein (901) ;mRNA; r:787359-790693